MAYEWIAARLAVQFLSDDTYSYAEQRAICERAHAGLIAAKADLLIWNEKEHRDQLIPKEFWWAEGEAALEQNWDTGDFETWINQKMRVRAFGVSFDFLALTDLAVAERRAAGLHRISVLGDEQWISSRDLHRLMYGRMAVVSAGPAIIEASAMGQLTARAVRAGGTVRVSGTDQKFDWAAREWDVPLWFWRDFTKPDKSMQDWPLGKLRGSGFRNAASETIELQGLHFHRDGLILLGLAAETPVQSQPSQSRGRPAKYDWPNATAAVWGRLYRGELIPDSQADIERALQQELTAGDNEPSESTVRPFAKPIWEEFQKA